MDWKWGKPNSIVTENEYRSWVHCMTLVVMTVEDILLSAIMTFMTLLCQSYDREIDFLTRVIVSIRTVLILLFIVPAVLKPTLQSGSVSHNFQVS